MTLSTLAIILGSPPTTGIHLRLFHAPRTRAKPPTIARVVNPHPITPNSGMLNGLGSILLASLWDVATDRIEERRPPLLVVDEIV
jgi:hypothetical protein